MRPLSMLPPRNKGLWKPGYTQELVAKKQKNYLVDNQVQWLHTDDWS